jgi:hypothetical protein
MEILRTIFIIKKKILVLKNKKMIKNELNFNFYKKCWIFYKIHKQFRWNKSIKIDIKKIYINNKYWKIFIKSYQ